MSQSEGPPSKRDRTPNRLIREQSPYLRQHAYNPVDWHPWGEEALAEARTQKKPILLSIGYSACHWCHVMERESFENDEIARLMNENFVPIKVDREERPDLDQVYMDAVQLMSGHGGWPLTVFLTPDGEPFYGGTYFPPEDRHGLAGFPRVLTAVAEAWRERLADVNRSVRQITDALRQLGDVTPSDAEPRRGVAQAAARSIARAYDSVHGGIGSAPKFPNPGVFSLFLRALDADHDPGFGEMVRLTLERMARGGIYDQLGGGFHRYSVDERWLVPHFEKMLYDNVLLARLYLDAGRVLGEEEFLTIARETLDYMLREMTGPEGGFYSSQDADSEGEEGRFFLWTLDEVRALLGASLAPIAERYYDVSAEGNFDGRNILHRTVSAAETARLFGKPEAEMRQSLDEIRQKLFAARERRVRPGRDEKCLTAWNAMAISAFAAASRALSEPRYLEAARRTAEFASRALSKDGVLCRSYSDGVTRFDAYLEDYALLCGAMIDLYEASLDRSYLERARQLGDAMMARYLDRERGGFFFVAEGHEKLIVRNKPAFDGATPSGNSAAAMALVRLHAYLGDDRYMEAARGVFRLFAGAIDQQPFAFVNLLEAIDFYQRGGIEVVLVGQRDAEAMELWLARIGRLYLPNLVLFAIDPRADDPALLPEHLRAVAEAKQTTPVAGYVCRERVCSAPTSDPEVLEAELRGQVRG